MFLARETHMHSFFNFHIPKYFPVSPIFSISLLNLIHACPLKSWHKHCLIHKVYMHFPLQHLPPIIILLSPQWPLFFKIQYNKQIWYDAYYVRNSKTEQINFARERQAAVQPTINAASKMFAPSQTVHLVNIYLCMHTQLGGIY